MEEKNNQFQNRRSCIRYGLIILSTDIKIKIKFKNKIKIKIKINRPLILVADF